MRLPVRLLCLALACPGLAHANDLMRVYDLAAQNDANFRAAQHARDASIEARPQAWAALLPQVNGEYSDGKSKETGTESFNGLPATTIDRDSSSSGLTVSLSQALFDWEAIQALRQSGDVVALAETNLRAARQDLVLRVAQAYFGVLAAADNLRTLEAEHQALERQLEQARKRFEVGLSAITDVQETQARYDLSVANRIIARQTLDSAREALAEITGQPATEIAALQEDFPLPAPNPTEVGAWVRQALEGNLDLLAARYNAEIAEKGVNRAWSRHLPTVGAVASYQDSEASGSRFSGESETESYGLRVNVPIFAGGATQSGVRQATATREQRRSQYEGTRRLVERSTRDAYQGVVAGVNTVQAYKQAVISSTTALEASQTGLEVGTRTAVDVLNAQQLLYAAQRTYYQSRYDYLLSYLRLKAATGALTEKELVTIDRLLVGG